MTSTRLRRGWPLATLLMLGCGSDPAAVAPADSGVADAHVADATHDAPHDVAPRAETAAEPAPPKVPGTLAETGLYSDFATRALAAGVFAYDVRYPLWSDGADKARFLFVPAGKTIDTSDQDHWVFPVGTRAWKEFRVGGKLVETRYLEKTGEEPIGWRYASYVWSEDGKVAAAAPAGALGVLGTTHDVPDQAACETCHSGTRDGLIGVNAIQLGELSGLAAKGVLDKAPSGTFDVPGAGLVKDVLGYLHGNCGYCHSDAGRWSSVRPLRLHVPVGLADPTKSPLYLTAVGKPMAHADLGAVGVKPGDPAGSQLWVRLGRRDLVAMPPVGSKVVDAAAIATIKSWIEAL